MAKNDKILYGIKYRFYPTNEQKKYINGMFGARRFFWNKILEKYNHFYEENKNIKEYNETHEDKKDLIPYFLISKKNKTPNNELYGVDAIIKDGKEELDENGEPKDFSWLKEYHSTIYPTVISDLGLAWEKYYKDLASSCDTNTGQPKKKHRKFENSVKIQNTGVLCDGKNVMDWKHERIKIPGFKKIGWCKCVLHKRFKGKVKQTTISRDIDGRYYIALTIEENTSYPLPINDVNENNTIGIDFGLKTFATISDVNEENVKKINPTIIDKVTETHNKIKKLQRKQSKCLVTFSRNGSEPYSITIREMNKRITENKHAFNGWHKEYSKNYAKYQQKIAKLTTYLNRIKKNYIENFANTISNKDDISLISVEDLSIRDMIIRDKTKVKENKKLSKNVRYRKAMSRKFADFAIGKTIEQLEYCCQKNGKNFIKIGRYEPSTKTCSCGHKLASIDLSTRKWTCPICGKENDRDINAAHNVAKWGLEKFLITKKS